MKVDTLLELKRLVLMGIGLAIGTFTAYFLPLWRLPILLMMMSWGIILMIWSHFEVRE